MSLWTDAMMAAERPDLAVPSRSGVCDGCGRHWTDNRLRKPGERRFCSDACRVRSWKVAHGQARLEFGPTANEQARIRLSKGDQVLARLRRGPATTMELARITVAFSQRLGDRKAELAAEGLRVERTDHCEDGAEWSVYELVPLGEP